MSRLSLTRRDLLKRAGKASLTLAAAQTLLPLVFSGDRAPELPRVKVGILHSLTGFIAIAEAALKDAELMAIGEINDKGGALGKRIDVLIEDPASNFDRGFPDKALKLLREDKVAAVFGCWTSASRKMLLPLFEQHNGLLFYPVPYEGNEHSKNIIYTGTTPNQQALSAVEWLMSKGGGGRRRFYLIGSDYIYPRTVNMLITRYLNSRGLTAVGEKYIPLGERDCRAVVRDIVTVHPRVAKTGAAEGLAGC